MKMELNDLEMIEAIKGGQEGAFEMLISKYEAKIYSMALRYTRNQEDAEEVLQDVFVTVYRKIEFFEGKSAFSSWLHRIVVNAAFMKLRKNRQNKSMGLEDLSPALKQEYLEKNVNYAPNSDGMFLQKQLQEALGTAINKLPEEYRSVFVLRDVDGLSNQEVSAQLKITLPAVKSRLHRARLMLRKKLKKFWRDFSDSDCNLEFEESTGV